jgi:pyruvate dehydrogenase E2 component (dihydrolipoamide acetyltransferase)
MNSILSINLRRGISQSIRLQNKNQSLAALSKGVTGIPSSITENSDGFSNKRSFSSLPYHLVVGMPALSPTMEAGTIASWKVKEGEEFAAGDSLAEIETDKATIDFEAQDDGVVAKILVEAGSGEIPVGVPIIVTVEDTADVAAFKDFVPETVAEEKPAEVAPPTPAPAPTPTPTPVVEKPVVPPTSVAAAVTPEPVPVVTPAPGNVAVASAESEVATSSASMLSPGWGNFAKIKSPLASTLSASQKKYIELYGSTGQIPL